MLPVELWHTVPAGESIDSLQGPAGESTHMVMLQLLIAYPEALSSLRSHAYVMSSVYALTTLTCRGLTQLQKMWADLHHAD